MFAYCYAKYVSMFFLLLVCLFPNHTMAQPSMVLQQQTFDFKTVPEGQLVEHTFTIGNKGTSNLVIKDAQVTCSCTTMTFDKTIPPGKEGAFKVSFDSRGYGGKNARVHIRIKTNDREKPVTQLVLSGKVDKLYHLEPPIVRLEGAAGKTIKQRIILKPLPKYSFSVISAKAQKGRHLKFSIGETCDGDQKIYHLDVEIQKDTQGLYFDKIFLTTNCPHKPEIRIAVFARITG